MNQPSRREMLREESLRLANRRNARNYRQASLLQFLNSSPEFLRIKFMSINRDECPPNLLHSHDLLYVTTTFSIPRGFK